METNPIDLALARAIKALAGMSEDDIRNLPLLDCTLILSALPDVAALASIRQQLAVRLCKCLDVAWIETGNIGEVFSVFAALWEYNPAYVTGEQLVGAVQRLVKSEVAIGGPYHSYGVIILTANIHVARFMHLLARPLPNVDALLAKFVRSGSFEDTELTSVCLLYLVAKVRDYPELIEYSARRWREKNEHTPEQTAMIVTILSGKAAVPHAKRSLIKLCKQQQANGFWDGEPLLKLAPARTNTRFATTALVVEALAMYRQALVPLPVTNWERKHHIVTQAARQLFGVHAEPLRSSALDMVDKVCGADQNFEITLLPQLFAKALKSPPLLTDRQYTMLGLASVCGWIAYTIYDDFLDGDGVPAELPIANTALRASWHCFNVSLPKQANIHQYISDSFTAMDEANAWEVTHCRFRVHQGELAISQLPQYGTCSMLAARSFAHALAPVAILSKDSLHSSRVHHVESAFRHYLIARQLNDDMRDWQADIQAGQASYVVTAILRDMRTIPGTYSLPTLLPAMRTRFRHTTMPKVARRTLRHIAMSRRDFTNSQLLRPANDIYGLLDTIERSVQHSLDEHTKMHALATMPSDRHQKL